MIEKKKGLQWLGGLLMLAAGILYSCGNQHSEEFVIPEQISSECEETQGSTKAGAERETVFVHVCGAVNAPGVYELPSGSRYQDAVQAAGGFSGEADSTYLNLATVISDGEQLAVPTVQEAASRREGGPRPAEDDGRVDLNQAGKEELMTLPGIGEVRAEAILSYRNAHGPFSSVEELMEVSGIKASTFEKIKEKVKVGSSDG